jgi:thiosulfate/3-mercaptopyruvate sulfurtransferase
MGTYAHPEVLVETDWVATHGNDPGVRLVEVDVDAASYEEGHVPGAVGWNWAKQLCDTRTRDILSPQAFERLMCESGISRDTRVVLYGDSNNWFAAWAFWQMKIYGHSAVQLMNGGRNKWLAEGRDLTTDAPSIVPARYEAGAPDLSLRAMLSQVQAASAGRRAHMVDVRSAAEFTGELLAPPGLPETCQRGGHIPGARNVPWGKVCNEDGSFKSYDDLKKLYADVGVDGTRPIIAYCRIGERSSHTWFALKYLLGFADVTNYDGSWTEWGNLVQVPIERGAAS